MRFCEHCEKPLSHKVDPFSFWVGLSAGILVVVFLCKLLGVPGA